jgi:hypothetical protein
MNEHFEYLKSKFIADFCNGEYGFSRSRDVPMHNGRSEARKDWEQKSMSWAGKDAICQESCEGIQIRILSSEKCAAAIRKSREDSNEPLANQGSREGIAFHS